ncbi:hypothetical protein Tco_1388339 [Tanacetum coccineum]
MDFTQASSSNPSKKIKLTIIPPRQLFVNISSDEDVTTTPSRTTISSSLTPPNAPSKTPSTNQTSSSQENTSSSFQSKLQISPPSSNEPTSPQPLNSLLENISDVPPRPSNPQPLQSHPSLDITLSLSPITPLDHILDTYHHLHHNHHLSWVILFTSTIMTIMVDSNKPPDPILEEFCTLTRMSSSNISHKPFVPNSDVSQPKPRGRPKGVKNHIKSVKIKVQSPGSASAGAGAILKRLHNSKMVGKGRSRSESSPLNESNGKCSNSCNNLVDEVLSKVLDRISYDKSINSQMVFKEGPSNGVKFGSRGMKNDYFGVNDGSFIKDPIKPIIFDVVCNNMGLENKGVLWVNL